MSFDEQGFVNAFSAIIHFESGDAAAQIPSQSIRIDLPGSSPLTPLLVSVSSY